MKSGISILLLIVCIGLGCKADKHKHISTITDAISYVQFLDQEPNDYKTIIHSGLWNFRFQLKPSLCIALKEQERDSMDLAQLKKRIVDLKRTVWFNVHLSLDGKSEDPLRFQTSSLEEYNKRLTYFLSDAGGSFKLYYGGQEMKQIAYHFENNHNLKPELIMVVGYQIPDDLPSHDLTIEYSDELFNAGILKFSITRDALKSLPNNLL